MKYLTFQFLVLITIQQMTLFDFNFESNIRNWKIVDDVVMGGRSNGNFKINDTGYGEFSGDVSLKNNGGFSSVRYNFNTVSSSNFKSFQLRIKEIGKPFQFPLTKWSLLFVAIN